MKRVCLSLWYSSPFVAVLGIFVVTLSTAMLIWLIFAWNFWGNGGTFIAVDVVKERARIDELEMMALKSENGPDLHRQFQEFFYNEQVEHFMENHEKTCRPGRLSFSMQLGDYFIGFTSPFNNALILYLMANEPEARKTFQFQFVIFHWHYASPAEFFDDLAESTFCPFYLDLRHMEKREGKSVNMVFSNEYALEYVDQKLNISAAEHVVVTSHSKGFVKMRDFMHDLEKRDGVEGIFRKKSAIAKALWQPKLDLKRLLFVLWNHLTGTHGKYIAVHLRRGDKIAFAEMENIPIYNYSQTVKSVCVYLTGNSSCPHSIFVMTDEDEAYQIFRGLLGKSFRVYSLRDLLVDLDLTPAAYVVSSPDSMIRKVPTANRAFWDVVTKQVILEITLLAMADQIVCTMSSNICRLAALLKGSYGDSVHSLDDAWNPF